MVLKLNKYGMVFSILSLFLAFLILSLGSYFLYSDHYEGEASYKENRISFLNSEFLFLKEVYFPNILTFSTYNAFYEIISNSTILEQSENYHDLVYILKNIVLNGTYSGNFLEGMENKTIDFYMEIYRQDLYNNIKAEISYDFLSLVIYEVDPYYVTAEFEVFFYLTSLEGITVWNTTHFFEISVPVKGLYYPEFKRHYNESFPIISHFDKLGGSNWTTETFNESLREFYSNVYVNSNFKYSIGNSFLNNLINVSPSGYKDVLGFWSFDHDRDYLGIYDTSRYNNLGKFYGTTYLLLNFDDEDIKDFSSYNHSVSFSNPSVFSNFGLFLSSANMSAGNVSVANSFDLDGEEKVSFSMWVRPSQLNSNYNLIEYGSSESLIRIGVNSSNYTYLELGNHGSSIEGRFYFGDKLILDRWSHLAISIDGASGSINFYLNGVPSSNYTVSTFTFNSSLGLFLGSNFEGFMDEVGVYKSVISPFELSVLYRERKISFLNYVESKFEKGIYLNGVSDYARIFQKQALDFGENISVELWFKPFSDENIQNILELNVNGDNLNFRLNHDNFEVIMGTDIFVSSSSFELNEWNYFSFVKEGSSCTLFYENNSVSVNNSCIFDLNNWNFTYIGKDSSNNYFYGIIDEIKIYNRSLSNYEVTLNYFNYPGHAKGCCNYITLINPLYSGLILNPLSISENVSYSTRLFTDWYKFNNLVPNITVISIRNITLDLQGVYPNFKLDFCMFEAFNVFSFEHYTSLDDTHFNYVHFGDDVYDVDSNGDIIVDPNTKHMCAALIRKGIY